MSDRARYRAEDLVAYARDTLASTGLTVAMAQAMADRMIDAELFEQRTHGLNFLGSYIDRIARGAIAKDGSHTVVADRGASFAWNAQRLPGAWMMALATQQAIERVATHGSVTATIADCSHIGCLQAYLLPFTQRGLMVQLSATNPGIRSVAPFGGIDPVLTTNPMAMGIPSRGTPILIDQSTSLASNALFARYAARGERLPGPWLLGADGVPTDDASAIQAKPPATILPLGGVDFGYKGYGFGLMVEALTLALPGCGRKNARDAFGQGVYLHVVDPAAFVGRDAFLDEIDHLAAQCRASRPRPGVPRVRVPGDRAMQGRATQLQGGVLIAKPLREQLQAIVQKTGVAFPTALA